MKRGDINKNAYDFQFLGSFGWKATKIEADNLYSSPHGYTDTWYMTHVYWIMRHMSMLLAAGQVPIRAVLRQGTDFDFSQLRLF